MTAILHGRGDANASSLLSSNLEHSRFEQPCKEVKFEDWVECCQRSAIGKILPTALYIHHSVLDSLHPLLQQVEHHTRQHFYNWQKCPDNNALRSRITLVKFHFDQPKLSYLIYPDFDNDPHPALELSIQVAVDTGEIGIRTYSSTSNPPVLHRKDTFITPDYPHYAKFRLLTRQQDALCLLDNSREIGFYQNWTHRLAQRGIEIHDHVLACPISSVRANGHVPQCAPSIPSVKTHRDAPPPSTLSIDRHKAALVRTSLSKPVRLALEAGLFTPSSSFFDYGCGHGGDVQRTAEKGFASSGFDPYYQADTPLASAHIVNLGYVINVIEDQAERRTALLSAWNLTQTVLIVAAQVLVEDRVRGLIAYEDGVITRRNTFQKNYGQEELKAYIDQVLGVEAIPAALGIYFVFRDETKAETFRASRFRSRARTPRVCASVHRFKEHKELLQPLMAFYTDRGRLPYSDEIDTHSYTLLQEQFGTIKRAFKLVLQASDRQDWDAITERRRQDLLVYLALSHFSRRPRFRALSPLVQKDIKALFGNYKQACVAADLMLLSLGNLEAIAQCCQESAVGQARPHSLWVHVSALEQLDPLLRLYEGCASRTIGRPNEANLVKLHFNTPKVTYLSFPNFDTAPHPSLRLSMQVSLRDLHVRYRDYDPEDNPPLLHQKEQVVMSDYLSYGKFAKLSQQERNWGLLDEVKVIGDRRGWEKCLEEHCAELRGHRIVWRKDADPYQVKLVKAAIRRKQSRYNSGL